jgi:plasmid stability protein
MSESSYPSDKQDKFMLRLPDGMRERIKAVAATNNRSMNAEIVATLQEKYPEPTVDDVKAALTALLARLDRASTLEEAKVAAQEVEGKMKVQRDE